MAGYQGADRGMSKPGLTMIAARARNGVIGHQNRMPWHLPEDLKHLRQQTMGHVVLLGRKTWESIGRPLPGRRMVVISRQSLTLPEGVELAASLDEAIARHATEDEIMVMGGAQIYEQAWSQADRLLLTEIALDPPGDAWLAAPDPAQWQEVSRQNGTSQDGVAYAFIEYRRRRVEALGPRQPLPTFPFPSCLCRLRAAVCKEWQHPEDVQAPRRCVSAIEPRFLDKHAKLQHERHIRKRWHVLALLRNGIRAVSTHCKSWATFHDDVRHTGQGVIARRRAPRRGMSAPERNVP